MEKEKKEKYENKVSVRSKYAKWILGIYILLVLRFIVFKYPIQELRIIAGGWGRELLEESIRYANFTLFKTIRMYIRYYDRLNSFDNLFGNIVIFIPYAILLPAACRRLGKALPVLLTGFAFSTAIELFQLITGFGRFDVDDILLNFMGVVLGFLINCCIVRKRYKNLIK